MSNLIPVDGRSDMDVYAKWFEIHASGESFMTRLFNRLDGLYPHWWRSNFAGTQAVDNWAVAWAEAFEEEKITPAEIAAGLKNCRAKFDKPPSCAEFTKACRPVSSFSTDKAYYEAVALIAARRNGEMGVCSHPAIYWAAVPLAYDLGTQTYSQIKTRWETALNAQMERGEWLPIPTPSEDLKALPSPGKATLSRENATRLVDQASAQIASRIREPGIDVSWATKILERDKKGDRSITITVRKFAMEALGLV